MKNALGMLAFLLLIGIMSWGIFSWISPPPNAQQIKHPVVTPTQQFCGADTCAVMIPKMTRSQVTP